VSRLSQARRHSWRHSQITRLVVNMRRLQRGRAREIRAHFLALTAPMARSMALNDAVAGQVTGTNRGSPGMEGRATASLVHGKLPSLAFQVHVEQVPVASKTLPLSKTPCSAGFGYHNVTDAFISINSFKPLGATHPLGLTFASTLAHFNVRS
jgi:hypothetical protein